MRTTIDIPLEINKLDSMGLLNLLLADKATGHNITWATDQYLSQYGDAYAPSNPIQKALITGQNSTVIQTRTAKQRDVQAKRTKQKGEVFTPIRLVARMNSYLLREAYEQATDWKELIGSTMLEITCGEGPFLVTRYDTETGAILPLTERVGLLDTKLREVTAHTDTEVEWSQWAVRAYESMYGYEYQGDSLLIARINMVMSFIEYYEDRWNQTPESALLSRIADIVSWNVWQMDGLTGKTPTAVEAVRTKHQMSLFEEPQANITLEHLECSIHDWRANRTYKWSELKGERCNTHRAKTKRRRTGNHTE